MSAEAAQDFTAQGWETIFRAHGLGCFEDCWAHQTELFEAPNARRGGWSNVARLELADTGARRIVFLKRQENHNQRSWRHPLRGVPTLQLEFENIRRCEEHGVPALRALFFGRRRVAGHDRAVLITEELAGYRPLADWTALPGLARRAAIRAVANLLHEMQRHGMRHNNFYPKHIFLRPRADGGFDTSLIDLEKATWHRTAADCGLKDLRTLNRRAKGWSRADRLRFLREFLGASSVTDDVRRLWRKLAKLSK